MFGIRQVSNNNLSTFCPIKKIQSKLESKFSKILEEVWNSMNQVPEARWN